jgi:GT2 family glycosyltransferase/glycosyltransferase involved in cell wall biosynthesis
MSPKVGIVVVSYNASQAVRMTLASLRQAKNETSTKVILVDNASYEVEREKIRSAFDRHGEEESLPWEYIQLEKNMGFSGGNNIGIRHLLDDPQITHICLLNSDVILADYWLDRLVGTQRHIVSTVTNKAESEQCIPIDYTLQMNDCLDEQTERIPASALQQINEFTQDWHDAWKGNLVQGEATFFCVLLSRQVLEELGLLDETFFPGGYEDDDFCLRARQAGYEVNIARDVFIHHWGSASFGQLQYEYFKKNASRNLEYLEKKHGIVRRRRPEKPFESFLMDVKFAATQRGNESLRHRFYKLYVAQLSALMKHFASEFKNLYQALIDASSEIPLALQAKIERAKNFQNITATWRQVVSESQGIFMGTDDGMVLNKVLTDLEYVIEGVWVLVECNFAIYAFLYEPQNEQVERTANVGVKRTMASSIRRFRMIFQFFGKGVNFLWKLQGIVFFGGYPYPERQSDGYFQRIQMVDHLFTDRWRIYVEGGYIPGRTHWIDRPEAKVLVLRIVGSRRHVLMAQVLALLSILRCRKVYFHSILTMQWHSIERLFSLPGLTKVIDIHGVVTEEFRLNNDFYNAMIYERLEQLAIRKCDVIIVVTKAMENYLRQKYRKDLQGRVVLFPMFPNYPATTTPKPQISEKPRVVYAGGLQKWQQVSQMVSAISFTHSLYEYRFYCPEPSTVREMLPERDFPDVEIGHKTRDELLDLYPECHYGFILREDNIVNQVACPTKLVEYLAMGIVPIINTENIGDFQAMGMQSVTLDALLRGFLPNESQRSRMARHNFRLYKDMSEIYKEGANQVQLMLTDKSKIRERGSRLQQFKGLLPPNTRRGHLARLTWMKMRSALLLLPSGKADTRFEFDPPLLQCDILVQVDNFEAGGLENIALDINDSLIRADHKVAMLILGTPGAGVERARNMGIPVLVGLQEKEWYTSAVKKAQPRLILSHYSIFGAEVCHELGIPFVQVIQNTYMWFNDEQRNEFKKAADLTVKFIALSEYAKRYSTYRLNVNEERCVVLPFGIDCQAYDNINTTQTRHELRSQYGFSEDDFVFLSVGAINHQKNHVATVRAFASLASEFPNVKLLILGPAYEPRLLDEILGYVDEQQLDGKVVYAGSAPSAQNYYAMADAFVSAAFFEGGPLNLLEAMKANLPTVITKVGIAGHFIGLQGINVIEPAVDIFNYEGALSQLSSTEEFEKVLASAMSNIYKSPHCPNIPSEIVAMFDKSLAFKLYVQFIEDLLDGHNKQDEKLRSTWVDLIEAYRGNSYSRT